MKNFMKIWVVLIFLVISYPCQAYYDEDCKPFNKEAERLLDKALSEYKLKKFEDAAELYQRAQRYYRRLIDLECGGNKGADHAKISMETCDKNIALCEKNAELQKKKEEAAEAVESYNDAAGKFKEGNQFSQKRKWQKALNAYKEAKEIWENISEGKPEVVEKAQANAEKALERIKDVRKKINSDS